jgi:hypothetical protein
LASSAEEFAAKSAILDEHCAVIGRDPASIERSVQLFADPDNIENTLATFRSFIAVGVTHLICYFRPPYMPGIVHRVADEIFAPLIAEYAEQG